MTKINLIVAVGKSNEIGKGNDLLWSLPSDMKFFKEMTMGNVVVMGRKTWDSIGSKPLKGRTNIVLTNDKELIEAGKESATINGEFVQFLDRDGLDEYLYSRHSEKYHGEIFIIGGAKLYEEFANKAHVMYITEVERSYPDADTFFPEVHGLFRTELIERGENGGLRFTIRKYERV